MNVLSKEVVLKGKGLFDPSGFGWSHVVKAKGTIVFISGAVALDAQCNLVGKGDIEKQTRQVFENLVAALTASGATTKNVVKLNVYLTDISQYDPMKGIRFEYFKEPFPAMTTVVVTALSLPDLLLEIEAIAVL